MADDDDGAIKYNDDYHEDDGSVFVRECLSVCSTAIQPAIVRLVTAVAVAAAGRREGGREK